MPAQEIAFRNDKVVYWPFVRRNRYGEPIIGSAEERTVRFDNKQTLARDPQGNKILLDASMVADREYLIGSIVHNSTIEYFVGTGSGDTPLELFEVVSYGGVDDLKKRATAYLVGLKRYKGVLPEIDS